MNHSRLSMGNVENARYVFCRNNFSITIYNYNVIENLLRISVCIRLLCFVQHFTTLRSILFCWTRNCDNTLNDKSQYIFNNTQVPTIMIDAFKNCNFHFDSKKVDRPKSQIVSIHLLKYYADFSLLLKLLNRIFILPYNLINMKDNWGQTKKKKKHEEIINHFVLFWSHI